MRRFFREVQRISHSPSRHRRARKIFSFLALSAAIMACQIFLATVRIDSTDHDFEMFTEDVATIFRNETSKQSRDERNRTQPANFGACVMVKDDNDLLYEWIAYHYTVLPLGYLVVGSDIDNSQDPRTVLNRWSTAGIDDLRYWILIPQDFIHRHGNYDKMYGSNTTMKDGVELPAAELKMHHHHALIHRQKGFMSTCAEHLKKRGVGWTLYIDSDEFVAWNPLTSEDAHLEVGGKGHHSISIASYANRKDITDNFNKMTVLDFLLDLQRRGGMAECYTMPRLLVGALENRSCSDEYGVRANQQLARANLNDRFQHMSTLRFFQHAQKGDFVHSKYGKVMMDLSKISNETIRLQQPRNIHRPYAAHCGAAGGAHFPNALFFLMHYVGSWERYTSRRDPRRDRRSWELRAFVDYVAAESFGSSACATLVANWYPRFLRRVGEGRTKFLLGVQTTDFFEVI